MCQEEKSQAKSNNSSPCTAMTTDKVQTSDAGTQSRCKQITTPVPTSKFPSKHRPTATSLTRPDRPILTC